MSHPPDCTPQNLDYHPQKNKPSVVGGPQKRFTSALHGLRLAALTAHVVALEQAGETSVKYIITSSFMTDVLES